MFELETVASLPRERLGVVAEELRRLLRRRDQLSLEASRLAGELERLGYGEAMGSISTVDWIRHECQLGYQSATDLVCLGLEMESLADSVAAVQDSEIGFQHLVLIARTRRALSESAQWRQGSWCEAHHVVPWTRGGATNPDNLVLLCSRHHMQVSRGALAALAAPRRPRRSCQAAARLRRTATRTGDGQSGIGHAGVWSGGVQDADEGFQVAWIALVLPQQPVLGAPEEIGVEVHT
jgi:HNH endonuclease